MSSICILTDNTALFPSAASGNRHLHTFPLKWVDGHFHVPGAEEFQRIFADLERSFQAILVLTVSEHILPIGDAVQQAVKNYTGPATIEVLDSQQIGPGLGLLAQLGARAILEGAPLAQVEECLRAAIPHLYTLLAPEFDHFAEASDRGAISILSMEEGALTPYKKVRTRRHLLESLQEFIEEFEHPQQISYFRGHIPNLRARPLRETVGSLFPGVPFTEATINPTLTVLFGPQTVGLTLMELPK